MDGSIVSSAIGFKEAKDANFHALTFRLQYYGIYRVFRNVRALV